jgi:hypothetical protein
MVDGDGTIYISYTDFTIKRVSPDGTVTDYAGLPWSALSPYERHQDGTLATARFNRPERMAKGPDGTLYVGEWSRIRAIRGENVTTLAGRGEDFDAILPGEIRVDDHYDIIDGPGPVAYIGVADDLWFDSDGRLMFWDTDMLRTVAMDGTVTTVAYGRDINMESAFKIHAPGQVMDTNGNAYYPSKYFDAIDGAAMIKRLPDGSKEPFGKKLAHVDPAYVFNMGRWREPEVEPVQDGPLETATFDEVGSLGYDPDRDCLYTMEKARDKKEFILRKIDLGKQVTAQLMGEQLYRQSAVPLPPNVVQTISEFSGAKNPKRVFLDAVKNRGVALPRPVESETEEALRLELAKPEPNQSKIAALRRELARKGGRRTRRRKANRKKKMTRKRRSTSS